MNWLTVKEAAEQLSISPELVYLWCKTGDLPHYRVGAKPGHGTIRIKPDDLLAHMEKRRVGPKRRRTASVQPGEPFAELDASQFAHRLTH